MYTYVCVYIYIYIHAHTRIYVYETPLTGQQQIALHPDAERRAPLDRRPHGGAQTVNY